MKKILLIALFYLTIIQLVLSSKTDGIFAKNMSKNRTASSRSVLMSQLTRISHYSSPKQKNLSNLLVDIEKYDIEKMITKPTTSSSMPPIFKPAHMLNKRGYDQIKKIYENFKNGDLVFTDSEINTIRYVPAIKIFNSSDSKKLNFIFNLSQISLSEKILKAELYLNKKFIRHRLMMNLNYFLYKTKTENSLQLILNRLNKTRSASTIIDLTQYRNDRFKKNQNWHMFNIFDSINSFLSTRNNRFKYSSLSKTNFNSKVYYTYDHETSLNNNSDLEELILIIDTFKPKQNLDQIEPYLIIYSNEEDSQMKNFFQNRLPAELLEEKLKLNENLDEYEKQVDDENNDSRAESSEIYHSNRDPTIRLFESKPASIDHNLIKSKLIKKNISSNSILYNIINQTKNNNPQKAEFIFIDKMIKKKRDLSEDLDIDKTKLNSNEDSNLYLSWNENNWSSEFNETELKEQKIKCQTQPIIIDFEDMSFSNWIIEPKSFQSNYCSGSCKFPVNKRSTFSNYATLQSILNTIDLNMQRNHPPQLCCAPSNTGKLPIFYLDSNSNDYVVKNLPDMIVNECSCR